MYGWNSQEGLLGIQARGRVFHSIFNSVTYQRGIKLFRGVRSDVTEVFP